MSKSLRSYKLKLLTSRSNAFLKLLAAPGDKSQRNLYENIQSLKKAILEAEDAHIDVIIDPGVTPEEEAELVEEYDDFVLQVTDVLKQAYDTVDALDSADQDPVPTSTQAEQQILSDENIGAVLAADTDSTDIEYAEYKAEEGDVDNKSKAANVREFDNEIEIEEIENVEFKDIKESTEKCRVEDATNKYLDVTSDTGECNDETVEMVNNENRYVCDNCGDMVVLRLAIRMHMHRKHVRFRTLCNECEYGTSIKNLFINHDLEHHNEKLQGMNACALCECKAVSNSSVKFHMNKRSLSLKVWDPGGGCLFDNT